MLHFKPFSKTFNLEVIKSPFLETVKLKIVILLVTTSGNFDLDFTEKSQFSLKVYKKAANSTRGRILYTVCAFLSFLRKIRQAD